MTLHVAVLAFTDLPRDHRVLRTIEALSRFGRRVTAIGFGDGATGADAFVRLPPMRGLAAQRLATALTQAPANGMPASAVPLHFLLPHHRAARTALLELRPDVIHANDWPALPSAVAAKRAHGGRIVYDSHELAVEEHVDNIRWRLIAQRHVREIERRLIPEADRVVAVSEGIAADLEARYALPVRPAVVRNTPAYQAVAPAPLSEPRRLLFHGLLKRGRGIEAMIAALPHLPNCILTLRGNGAPSYEAGLRDLASRLGVDGRVTFEPLAPHQEVVLRAAEAHVGIFCAPAELRQNRFSLPNKIFEYLMAGLAVVVTAGTELAELVEKHGCGVSAAASTPEAIAAAVHGLSADALQGLRSSALEAARELSWDEEQAKLRSLYEELALDIVRRGGPAGGPTALKP